MTTALKPSQSTYFTAEGPSGAWEYQTVELPSLQRVQLWFRMPTSLDTSRNWQIGHGKDIPAGRTAAYVADMMRAYVLGWLTHDEYNDFVACGNYPAE